MLQKDIVYSEHSPACKLDAYLPDGEPKQVYLYLHGGGLTAGDKEQPWAEELCKRGIAVLSANYRMYPQAKFPEFIEDCAAAAAYMKQKFSCPAFIGGSSAGGYLTQMLYFDKHYLAAFGLDADRDFAGYIFDAGQPTNHFNVLKERGMDPRLVRVDETAPIYFLQETAGEKQHLPRFFFMVAEKDMPGRAEQNRMLYASMLHFGYLPEQLSWKLFDGFAHCQYVGNEEYVRLTAEFIQK